MRDWSPFNGFKAQEGGEILDPRKDFPLQIAPEIRLGLGLSAGGRRRRPELEA